MLALTTILESDKVSDSRVVLNANMLDLANALSQKTWILAGHGDGCDFRTTDYDSDDQAIQAAIDYVAANGYGGVRVGFGTFVIETTLRMKSNMILSGCGFATILQAKPLLNNHI